MLARLFIALAFSSVTLSVAACDAPADESAAFRVVVRDTWGVHDPAHFPETNSCDDYWNTRCADLSPDSCALMKVRYVCSESKLGGVVIGDRFAAEVMTKGERVWTVTRRGKGAGAPAASPKEACAQLGKPGSKDVHACLGLVAVQAVEAELRALAPEGGLAPLLPAEALAEDVLPLLDGDLLVDASAALDWEVPALAFAARARLADIVIEDDIMLLLARDGTSVFSNGGMILTSWPRDKLDLDLDVDVK